MILVIDNYDSFTYNLVQQIEKLGYPTTVWLNDECTLNMIDELAPEKIVLSPGPKTPLEAGICMDVIRQYQNDVPILGVCLGHQAIGMVYGASIGPSQSPFHGTTETIATRDSRLFANLPASFAVARYHSLVLQDLPGDLMITATDELGEIMALEHLELPLFGVQFHPESIGTREGRKMLRNFLGL